ncbi:MAG: GNAT family N-acetyltransferase [Acidobacteria bacterium]|nr:GNAT family N-acetyltransferase [Acidobacteriota bacterium]
MSKPIFRPARIEDASPIAEFQIAMAIETEELQLDHDICHRGVIAVFENSAYGRYFVAEKDGTVIASLLITYEWSDWRNGLVWWIQSVYVVPAERGRGVFAGLYNSLREQAIADPNLRGIRLYADRRNTRAHEVYTRLGMDGGHYLVFEWMK